jgi:CRISPR-associated protein Cmr5
MTDEMRCSNSPLLTRQQQRAKTAFDCVSSYSGNLEDYKRLAKRFPALVNTCGLAQACAFVLAKEGVTGREYLSHLQKVMALSSTADLAELSRTSQMVDYQRLSREATESGSWLKRYAEAFIEDSP